ncbi:MAG TPA: hypothetical protein VGD55_07680 [Acidothermaceae bacterium]
MSVKVPVKTQENSPVMADAVIAQVIQLKDPDEAISSAVWWRVAELLRTCTTATTSGPHLTTTLLEHAFSATDDVLSSLSADSDPSNAASVLDSALPLGSGYDALAATRRSCLRLARLLFSLDATTPAVLATRVNQLRRALTAWRFEALDAFSS